MSHEDAAALIEVLHSIQRAIVFLPLMLGCFLWSVGCLLVKFSETTFRPKPKAEEALEESEIEQKRRTR